VISFRFSISNPVLIEVATGFFVARGRKNAFGLRSTMRERLLLGRLIGLAPRRSLARRAKIDDVAHVTRQNRCEAEVARSPNHK
jgi:hypothetical protein